MSIAGWAHIKEDKPDSETLRGGGQRFGDRRNNATIVPKCDTEGSVEVSLTRDHASEAYEKGNTRHRSGKRDRGMNAMMGISGLQALVSQRGNHGQP